jgi:hypothetical protein
MNSSRVGDGSYSTQDDTNTSIKASPTEDRASGASSSQTRVACEYVGLMFFPIPSSVTFQNQQITSEALCLVIDSGIETQNRRVAIEITRKIHTNLRYRSACRDRKIRCNRHRPICGRCIKLGITCRYSSRSTPTPSKMDLSRILMTMNCRLRESILCEATRYPYDP